MGDFDSQVRQFCSISFANNPFQISIVKTFSKINWLSIVLRSVQKYIHFLHWDVPITRERPAKLGLFLELTIFKQGGIFNVPHLMLL